MYTIAEYLALEEQAPDKHEYHEGEILAMSGGTYEHSRICTNLIAAFETRLRGKPCEALNDQLRVRIFNSAKYVYPDLSIVSGEIQFDPDDPKCSITNPRVVIEVLSQSTESYDRGDKFEMYRRLPSLEEYVLISQTQPQIDVCARQPDGAWRFATARGLEASLELVSLPLNIPLSEIYARLSFGSTR